MIYDANNNSKNIINCLLCVKQLLNNSHVFCAIDDDDDV